MTATLTKAEPAQNPQLKAKWLRGQENIDYSRPNTYLAMGSRGSGKSSLLEAIGSRYTKVIDLFGSKDAECLSWCKPESPFKDVLFVVGKNVTVASRWPSISIEDLTLKDIDKHEVVTTTYCFFNTKREYFEALQKITTMLWDQRLYWDNPWFMLIREAANWIYSRLQVVKNSESAKADFIQMLREARHSGLAVGLDTIRWTNLDKEVRDVSDYIFLKKVGSIGLPKDLRFVYSYVNPFSMMRLQPQNFVLLTGEGNIAMGKFDEPKWHKQEKENILLKLGIEIQRLTPDENELSGSIGVFEHAKIMLTYTELGSIGKVAAKVQRSKSTVHQQITNHNATIDEIGYCLECNKAKSPHAKIKMRKKAGRKAVIDLLEA